MDTICVPVPSPPTYHTLYLYIHWLFKSKINLLVKKLLNKNKLLLLAMPFDTLFYDSLKKCCPTL